MLANIVGGFDSLLHIGFHAFDIGSNARQEFDHPVCDVLRAEQLPDIQLAEACVMVVDVDNSDLSD